MANEIYTGSNGTIYVDGTAVASIRSFSFEETQEVVDATVMAPTLGAGSFRTNLATFKSWSGSVDVYWTTDDAATKSDLTLQPGPTPVTIVFYPSGDATGEITYTGDCLITQRTINSSVDGMIECSISVTGTTAIVTGNAA